MEGEGKMEGKNGREEKGLIGVVLAFTEALTWESEMKG